MQITSATPVTLTIPFTDDNSGQAYQPTALAWTLYDEADVSIATGLATPQAGDAQAQITIAGEYNLIDAQRGARRLEVLLTTDGGTWTVDQYYTIAKANALTVMTNSFMTYAGALMVRDSIGSPLDAWDAADQRTQIAALETAFVKIARLCFKIAPLDPTIYATYEPDDDGIGCWNYDWIITDIRSMPPATLQSLNPRFAEGLNRAQLIEANAMMGGDIITQRRADGVLSETIGESSMMFNSRPALQLPISRDAYREISRWVYRYIGTVRG